MKKGDQVKVRIGNELYDAQVTYIEKSHARLDILGTVLYKSYMPVQYDGKLFVIIDRIDFDRRLILKDYIGC